MTPDDDDLQLIAVAGDVPVPPDPSAGAGDERGSLKSGMGFAASSFVVNVVVQLLSAVLTARVYGVRTIGEYALVTAPWLTLVQFSSVSEQIALVRELAVLPARDVRVGRLFFPVLGFSSALTTVAAVIVGGLSIAALRGPVGEADLVLPALTVLIGYVVLENTSWNMDSVFSAFRAGREIFVARLVQAASFLVFAVGLRAVSSSVWSLAVATVVSFALAFGVRLTMVPKYLARTSRADIRLGMKELPRILRFGVRLVPGSIASGTAAQAATWLLGSLSTVATVGAYSRAGGIAQRLQDAGFRISEMVFPSLVERQHQGDDEGMRADLSLAMRGAAIPLLLVTAVGGGIAAGALSVFGDGFESADDALALLLLAYALSVLCLLTGEAMIAKERPVLTTSLVVLRSVLIIAFVVPGVVWFDATGAAAGFAAAYVVDIAIRMVLIRRMVYAGDLGALGRTAMSIVVAGGPAFVVARLLDTGLARPVGTIAGGIFGCAVYGALLLLTGGASADERRRVVDAVRRRITARRRQPAAP